MPPQPEPGGSESDRRRAAATAGHVDDEAGARRALSDESARVRATGLGALARLGALRATDVRSAARDPDPLVRARAAELASAAMSPDDATSLMITSMTDGEPTVVEAACFALGEIGEAAVDGVEALSVVARTHPDPLCREAAVAALGAVGDPAGLPAILDAVTDKPAVRRRAVIALAPFAGDEVEAALERALTDRDWQVRQAAEDLTGRRASGG